VSGPETGVVTPEAVRLEFEGANLGSRTLAALIDRLIQGVAFVALVVFGLFLVERPELGLPDWVGVVAVLLLVFALTWGYPVAFETLWRGRTPGKAALGLRVVTTEGAPVRFRHAAIRAILALVDFYLSVGAVAVLSVLLSKRQQRLGDLVAGTLVLRERTAAGTVRPVQFTVPRGAEAYATTVDPSGLTGDDYGAVRAFLLRASTLRTDARTGLGAELATRLAAKVGHTPSPGISPELFLIVLAARYQERSGAGSRTGQPAATSPRAASAPVVVPQATSPAPQPGTGFTPPS